MIRPANPEDSYFGGGGACHTPYTPPRFAPGQTILLINGDRALQLNALSGFEPLSASALPFLKTLKAM
jgi:hypothetical protein